jgi:hypothetical protein
VLEALAEEEARRVGRPDIQLVQGIDIGCCIHLVGCRRLGIHLVIDSHHAGCQDVILAGIDSTRQISCTLACFSGEPQYGEAGRIGHSLVLAPHGPRLPSNCPYCRPKIPLPDRLNEIGQHDVCE